MRHLIFVAVAGLIVGASQTAHATPITFSFTARVTFVQNAPVLGLSPSLGDPVSGFFTYDTTLTDTDVTNPARGIYHGGSASIQIGLTTISSSSAPVLVVSDQSPPRNDLFSFADGVSQSGNPILVNGSPVTNGRIGFHFTDPSGTVFGDDGLPDVTQLQSLQVAQFHIVQEDTNGVILFDNLTSFAVVPEPSTALLFAAGLVGLGLKRRLCPQI